MTPHPMEKPAFVIAIVAIIGVGLMVFALTIFQMISSFV
jgi:hypothetical protein